MLKTFLDFLEADKDINDEDSLEDFRGVVVLLFDLRLTLAADVTSAFVT